MNMPFQTIFGRYLEPGQDPNCRCAQALDDPRRINVDQNVRNTINQANNEGRSLRPDEIFNALSPADQLKVNRYVASAEENLPQFQRHVEDVAQKLGMGVSKFEDPQPGTLFWGPLKKPHRVAEKAVLDYGGRLDDVGDVLRMTFVADSPEQARRIHDLMDRIDVPVGFKDRFLNPTSAGYRDMMFKNTMRDGMRAEVQVNFREMILAKNGKGHDLYEEMRAMTRGSREWNAKMAESQEFYGGAWASACRDFPTYEGCN